MAMKQRRRIYYSPAQRAEIWDRWRRGVSMHDIGRLFDRGHSSIFSVLARTGGIRPPPRRRSRLALTLAEREEISRGLVAGMSLRSMAVTLGRSPSTLSREIGRNGGSRRYRAASADSCAWKRALRPKLCKLAVHHHLRQAVGRKLEQNWSPQQIAGWLKRINPGSETQQVSHETIYRSLYVQARGVLKKQLIEHLRSQRPIRRSRHATMKGKRLGQIPDAVSISQTEHVPDLCGAQRRAGVAQRHRDTLIEDR